MFSVNQKRFIANEVQKILRSTNHPELPPITKEVRFHLHVYGDEPWSWADIKNNEDAQETSFNPWNEKQNPVGGVKYDSKV